MSRERHIVLVLGMHRSGTSAITRALQIFGVALGNNLMPALENVNSKGFFEDLDFVQFNDSLLSHLASTWCTPGASQNSGALLGNTELRESGRNLLKNKCMDRSLFGLKDPRACRLLPFWLPIIDSLGINVRIVIASRQPNAVIKSLAQRDVIEPVTTLLLWIEHIWAAIHYSADRPRIVVEYDDLLNSPTHELLRLKTFLQTPNAINETDRDYFMNVFLDSGLNHATEFPKSKITETLATTCAARLYGLLCRMKHDPGAASLAKDRRLLEKSRALVAERSKISPT